MKLSRTCRSQTELRGLSKQKQRSERSAPRAARVRLTACKNPGRLFELRFTRLQHRSWLPSKELPASWAGPSFLQCHWAPFDASEDSRRQPEHQTNPIAQGNQKAKGPGPGPKKTSSENWKRSGHSSLLPAWRATPTGVGIVDRRGSFAPIRIQECQINAWQANKARQPLELPNMSKC